MLGFTSLSYITITVSFVGGLLAMWHLLLRHRDYRSAAFWMALIILSPLIAPLLYLLLGINILRRRGRHYRSAIHEPWRDPVPEHPLPVSGAAQLHQQLAGTLDRISRFCFTHGNAVSILHNGDERRSAASLWPATFSRH